MSESNIGSPLAQPGGIILGDGSASAGPATGDGTYVVSFTDVIPPIRYDNVAWTTVQIQQATALAGPWVLIDTQTIPASADPTNPDALNLTTSLATTQEGFFALTLIDTNGASSQPIVQVMNQPSEIRPTVAELGAFMRARTVAAGSGGEEQGTFNGSTRPTAVEADGSINSAVSAVLMQTGEEIPDHLIAQAKFAVLLYSAMLVELTFYRNEVNRDQSSYAQYEELFNRTITALCSAIADEGPGAVAPAFYSVPVMTESQERFQSFINATDLETGVLDPTKLPIDQWYPRGPGGIPAQLLQLWPWIGASDGSGGDWELTDLEASD
jgi:hypothetical protein